MHKNDKAVFQKFMIISWVFKILLSSHVLLEPPKIFSSRVYPDHKSSQKMILEPGIYPDHKFPQIITLHEDWNDGYNVSVRLKWRISCFPKATIPLLSFFWNFFLKEFICIPAQILEPGMPGSRIIFFQDLWSGYTRVSLGIPGSRICQWKSSNLFVEIFENKDGNSFVGF